MRIFTEQVREKGVVSAMRISSPIQPLLMPRRLSPRVELKVGFFINLCEPVRKSGDVADYFLGIDWLSCLPVKS
ncbi:hypothetical protein D3C76_1338340 [compost metagenome]